MASLVPYLSLARPDHWVKNGLVLTGAAFAIAYHPLPYRGWQLVAVGCAFAATCCVTSSNYVLNEVLDAQSDASHPLKRMRPAASGRVSIPLAYAEWLILGLVGLALASTINALCLTSATALWAMGMVYNARPLRLKEVPYVDVLTESLNAPLRLLLGWSSVTYVILPPVSLIALYWMGGAFVMACKRLAEYRLLADKAAATAYRRTFRHYDEPRLMASMFFYATSAAVCLGAFVVRYHVDMIYGVPLIAGLFSIYVRITLRPQSAAHAPERLVLDPSLMLYLLLCVIVFTSLAYARLYLHSTRDEMVPQISPLWKM